MKSLLYQVNAMDPAAVTSVTAVLLVAFLLACYIPARRATLVDPIVALCEE
jgi:ABC-type lipoprotein release transport system permease subunit